MSDENFCISDVLLLQLSYGSSSPVLSNRKRFPNFFRLVSPDQMMNPAKIALIQEFNWTKVATINQALEFFSVVNWYFVLLSVLRLVISTIQIGPSARQIDDSEIFVTAP